MKGLRGTKNIKGIKFQGIRGELESQKDFPETIARKIPETNSSCYMK